MSGGRFNYQDEYLKQDMFGYGDEKIKDPMEDIELSTLVFDVFNLIHDLDWYKSGDNGADDYAEAKVNFKKKWLRNENYDNLLKDLVTQEIKDLEDRLIEMIGDNKNV